MTREEAAQYFARQRDTLIWCPDNKDETRLAHDAYNTAIDAMRGPQPDPVTGLVPCGCGGKAVKLASGTVLCEDCFIAIDAVDNERVWNRAMGCKEEE